VLREIGGWMRRNGEAIYGTQRADLFPLHPFCGFWTAKGNTAYLHVFAWQGAETVLSGFRNKVRAVRLLGSGEKVAFEQGPEHLRLRGMPKAMPDRPATVLAIECAGRPDHKLGIGHELLKNDTWFQDVVNDAKP
jgi:alpha-L-fucosidase